MNKLYTSFLELVRKINDDALKVFDDAQTLKDNIKDSHEKYV